ncbi:MAG: hypothetical protein SEPTF4163_003448 [Sporothrix epigloea]
MDHSDETTYELEQQGSPHLSDSASISADTNALDAIDEGAGSSGTVMTLSDGVRPDVETILVSIPAMERISDAQNADDNEGRSVTCSAHEGDSSSIAATAATAPDNPAPPTETKISVSSSSSSAPDASSLQNSSSTLSASSHSPGPSASESRPSPSLLEPTYSVPSAQSTFLAAVRPSNNAKSSTSQLAQSMPPDNVSPSVRTNSCLLANVQTNASTGIASVDDEEPYQGPSGPSFPYQLYPQDVNMTRPLSAGEASTIAPSESSYDGPRRPTFPYTMYSQNTVAASIFTPVNVPGVPVGFPGVVDNYRRRIGPDGEDTADLVGPDGHTEQLPPYTRYPDEAYSRKIAAADDAIRTNTRDSPAGSSEEATATRSSVASATAQNDVHESIPTPEPSTTEAVPAIPASIAASAPVLVPETAQAPTSDFVDSVPDAGVVGLTLRNPELDGPENAQTSQQSLNSPRSSNSEQSGCEIDVTAYNTSEKGERKVPNFIQRYGGRRVFGIVPYWAICLVSTVLLLMCIILGSVLGVFLADRGGKQHLHQPGNYNSMSVTVTVDASPIPTPSNLPSLPTGTFSLPFAINESPSSCFNDTTQSQAWQCNIADQSSMTLTIDSLGPTADGPMYGITLKSNESATYQNNVFLYGEQAPSITMQSKLRLVENTLDSGRGLAWFKMVMYNKTVIVRENYLTAPSSQPTSSSSVENNNKKRRQFNGKPGLAARACYPGHKCRNTAQAGEKPWVCTWPDTILEIFIYPEQNSSACGGSVASTSMPTSIPPTPTLASSLMSFNESSQTLSNRPSTAPSMAPSQWLNLPPPYPRVVTMEERRMANSPEATCVQYELTLVGTALKAVPNLDANGQPIQLSIAEIESGPSFCPKGKRDDSGGVKTFKKREESGLSKCGCLWMVT